MYSHLQRTSLVRKTSKRFEPNEAGCLPSVPNVKDLSAGKHVNAISKEYEAQNVFHSERRLAQGYVGH